MATYIRNYFHTTNTQSTGEAKSNYNFYSLGWKSALSGSSPLRAFYMGGSVLLVWAITSVCTMLRIRTGAHEKVKRKTMNIKNNDNLVCWNILSIKYNRLLWLIQCCLSHIGANIIEGNSEANERWNELYNWMNALWQGSIYFMLIYLLFTSDCVNYSCTLADLSTFFTFA